MDCCAAQMKDRRHNRRDPNAPMTSRIDFDIAVYSREGPYVACARATSKDSRPVFLAKRLSDRSTTEIRIAIEAMIVEVHERWGYELFSRVHSDREGGLGALSMDLNRVGIAYTHTQGQDPSANGLAENCVSRVGALA